MRMARAPFGLLSGGVGTTTCRSGWWAPAASAHARQRPQAWPVAQSSAWANARAVVMRPEPAGPTNA